MTLRNVLILLARVGLGVIFVAHGWQKFVINGIGATQQGFASMGAPAPDVSAVIAATVELVGGIGLILGLATPVWALLLFAIMVGAFLISHLGHGLFVAKGGFEFVLALGASMLLLVVTGPGRFSVDAALGDRLPWNRGVAAPQV
ncbi:DoxX family protein [Mycolicibacterium sp. HK-90]|uniref:DoxX family protein n=1 Tax=Mycolicibacterium sp. HK-90 TaxID=3056937 RepID=UPI0026596EE4|nr:DoxX family protein [Mycolicibacterium sp. HK-90]WKG04273.1 DoxX family protein [Mycolicibacterium sp. HK-90]